MDYRDVSTPKDLVALGMNHVGKAARQGVHSSG
jgi:hypothetical protein